MRDMKEKIILYLTYAKLKLDLQNKEHQKANYEITKIIQYLESNEQLQNGN